MPFPEKLLGDGEVVLFHTRTHWKALVLPVIVLVAVCGAAGWGIAVVDNTVVRWVFVVLAVILLAVFVVRPWADWATSTDTLTNRRLITREGLVTRTGRDIPLRKINDVSITRGILDRMLGCGSLVVESAGERGQVQLKDIPDVEQMHLKLQEVLLDIDIPDPTDPTDPRSEQYDGRTREIRPRPDRRDDRT